MTHHNLLALDLLLHMQSIIPQKTQNRQRMEGAVHCLLAGIRNELRCCSFSQFSLVF